MQHTITILGLSLPIPLPYSEGHVCSALDAKALNHAHCEHIRTNLGARLREALAEHLVDTVEELPKAVQETLHSEALAYALAYRLGLGVPKAKPDPVQVLARKLAREAVLGALRRAERDPKDMPEGWLEAKIESVLSDHPYYAAEAARRIAAAQQAAKEVIELDL